MQPAPTTAEYVETHAARAPESLALRENGVDFSYAQFANILLQCGLHLQRLGLKRGERVAVSGPGVGMQLALLLAAEALGAVTVSFQAENDGDLDFVLAHADRVFSPVRQPVPAGVAFHAIDADFSAALAQPVQGPGPQWLPLQAHEPQRMTRTSGSTGASKFMLLDRGAQDWWIRVADEMWKGDMDTDTRLLVLAPFVVNAGFARICACLRRGGAIVQGGGADIATLAPTHVLGLPAHLERLLQELPAGYVTPGPVEVATFGGALSPVLRARAQAVFGTRIENRYGCNEAGAISNGLDTEGVGAIRAGVDVRILDPQGRELPMGQEGIVAVRSPSLVDGYLERPGESAAVFRDGWFVSGDIGTLLGRRLLRLSGRYDELVNIGGLKVPALRLEDALRAQAAIADAAVLAVFLEGGAVTLGVALVVAAGAAVADAMAQVGPALQLPADARARVLVVDALPRTAMGKLDRMALARLFR